MSICGRTILTLSDAAPDAAAPGPVFAEPWQARAFAIAVLASKQGCFTWSEWTHALGRELHRAQDVDAQAARPVTSTAGSRLYNPFSSARAR